jgi:3-oxoacyl-[acyl-carrier-protein] synthase-1
VNTKPLVIIKSGMVSAVGLNAPATCAAIRCGIDNIQETRFMDSKGEWIMGSNVPLEKPWRGIPKLLRLLEPAVSECLSNFDQPDTHKIPLLLCLSEEDRPGRLDDLNKNLVYSFQETSGLKFHDSSKVISNGCVGGAEAVNEAFTLIYGKGHPYCIVAGLDTFLTADILRAYEEQDRLLTSKNSNGFIPGEGGAAVLLGPDCMGVQPKLTIRGVGFGKETATIDSEEPLRADGMVQAFNAVFTATGLTMRDMNYRISDANGEQYKFKEGDLAVTRTLRNHKGEIDIWHPAESIGEVGAATVPFILGVAEAANRKGYSRGLNVLCHFSNDNGDRAVIILASVENGGN